jgi:hypothetical protein
MATLIGTDGQNLFYNDDSGALKTIPIPSSYSPTAAGLAPLLMNSVLGKAYGITANGQFVFDAVSTANSKTITSATANFTSGDVGKIVFGTDNTGTVTAPPQGVITSVVNANTITVSNAATASKTGVILGWGTDDTVACNAAWAAALAQQQYLELPSGFIFVQASLFNPVNTTPTKQIGLFSDGFSSLVPTPNFDFTTIPGSTNGMFFNCEFISGTFLFPNNAYIANIGVFGGNQSLSGQTHNCSIFDFGQVRAENIWVWNYGNADNALVAVTATGPANFDGLYIYVAGHTGLLVQGDLTQVVALSNGSYSAGQVISLSVIAGALLNSYGSYWGTNTGNPSVRIATGGVFNSYGDMFTGGFGYTNARSIDVSGTANIIGGIFENANEYGLNILSGGRAFISQSYINLTGSASAVALINAAGVFVDDGTNNYVAGTPAVIAAANITPSTGWGTTGAAGNGVSAVTGDIRRFQITVTAAGSPSSNPTITISFPWTQARTPLFICKQVGGTGAIAQVSGEASATTTTMTLTWNGTPQANDTYIFQCISE